MPAVYLCFLFPVFWMLDKGDLPRGITAGNYRVRRPRVQFKQARIEVSSAMSCKKC